MLFTTSNNTFYKLSYRCGCIENILAFKELYIYMYLHYNAESSSVKSCVFVLHLDKHGILNDIKWSFNLVYKIGPDFTIICDEFHNSNNNYVFL